MIKQSLIALLLFTVITHAEAYNPDQLIREVKTSYGHIRNYSCKLSKKELVDGKYFEQNNILLKFRKPLSIYMKWTEGEKKGTELIFETGKNKNKVLVHTGGLLKSITFSVDPFGSLALKETRHPVMDARIGKIIEIIDSNFLLAQKLNTGKFELLPDKKIDNRPVICIKATFPDTPGFYGGTNYIFIDKLYKLPVAVEIFGWKNELLERYEYTSIILNTAITDSDFNAKNENYDF